MTVRQRGTQWQADFMLSGKRIREQFSSAAAAEVYEMECRLAHKRGQPIPKPTGEASATVTHAATIGGLVDYCAQHHWKGKKSEQMLVMYARLFSEWIGPKRDARDVLTPSKVDTYVAFRIEKKRNSNATINRHLSAISVLLRYGKRLGLIESTFELPWKKEATGRLRYYTEAEEQQLLSTLMLWGYKGEWALIQFLADTGARLGEAQKLQWRDIDGRSITFVDTKSGKNRTVVATDRVLKAIEHMLADRRKEAGPFTWVNRHSLHKLWQRVVAHVGIQDAVNIHTWRHTNASRLVMRGVDLYKVQRWLGHSTPSMTQRYAHLSPKAMEDIAATLNGGEIDMTVRDGFELMIPRG